MSVFWSCLLNLLGPPCLTPDKKKRGLIEGTQLAIRSN